MSPFRAKTIDQGGVGRDWLDGTPSAGNPDKEGMSSIKILSGMVERAVLKQASVEKMRIGVVVSERRDRGREIGRFRVASERATSVAPGLATKELIPIKE